MKNRKILPIEKKKIKKLYESSFIFKLEETLVSTFFAFLFILFILFLLKKVFTDFSVNYTLVLLISLFIGVVSIKSKYKKRKKFLARIFSKKEPVKIYNFKIQRFINIYPESKNQFEYLCEIEQKKTLYFRTDKNLGNKLPTNLKIELIELEIPTILSISKTEENKAIEIFPKELNMGFLEENVEYEFYIYQMPLTDLYI